MKDFIARFKKAWAAFVRTWNFEKDVGSTTERVRKEVEYAIECEKKEATEDNDCEFEHALAHLKNLRAKSGALMPRIEH